MPNFRRFPSGQGQEAVRTAVDEDLLPIVGVDAGVAGEELREVVLDDVVHRPAGQGDPVEGLLVRGHLEQHSAVPAALLRRLHQQGANHGLEFLGGVLDLPLRRLEDDADVPDGGGFAEVHLFVGVGDQRTGGDCAKVDERDGANAGGTEVEDALEHGARVVHLSSVGVDAHQQRVDILGPGLLDRPGEVAVRESIDDVVDLHVADRTVLFRGRDRAGGVGCVRYGQEEEQATRDAPEEGGAHRRTVRPLRRARREPGPGRARCGPHKAAREHCRGGGMHLVSLPDRRSRASRSRARSDNTCMTGAGTVVACDHVTA